MKKKSLLKIRKFVIYVKKNFLLINRTEKSEIMVIIQEYIEELLIVAAMYAVNTKRDSYSIS